MIIKERRKAPAFRHGECQDEDIQLGASLFDSIKHVNEYGEEYWSARELIPLLEYNEYRFFKKVIDKAINACEATDNKASDHFVQVHEMVTIGSGAGREIENYTKKTCTKLKNWSNSTSLKI